MRYLESHNPLPDSLAALRRRRLPLVYGLCGIMLVLQLAGLYHLAFRLPAISLFADAGFSVVLEDGILVVDKFKAPEKGGGPEVELGHGDRLIYLQNKQGERFLLRSNIESARARSTVRPGEPFILGVIPREKPVLSKPVQVLVNPRVEEAKPNMAGLLAVILLPLIAIFTAFFLGFQKPEDGKAMLAMYFFLAFSTLTSSVASDFLPAGLREAEAIIRTSLNVLLVYLFMRFFLVFPSPSVIDRKAPWLKTVCLWLILPVAFISTGTVLFTLHSYRLASDWIELLKFIDPPVNIFFLLMMITGFVSLVLNTIMVHNRDEHRRMIILLAGTCVSILPVTGFVVYYALTSQIPPSFIVVTVLILLLLFPVSFVYVVVRHRVMGIRLIIRRGLQYALVSRAFLIAEVLVLFLLVYYLAEPFFDLFFPAAGRGLVAGVTVMASMMLAAGLRGLNRHIMPHIDKRFFRESYNAQQVLLDLGKTVRQMGAQTDRLLQQVVDQISDAIYPDHTAVFLRVSGRHAAGRPLEFDLSEDNPFRCVRHRLRTLDRDDAIYSHEFYQTLTLPPSTHTVRNLERAAGEEKQALEMYPDDPRSFAHGILGEIDAGREKTAEQIFLEALNPRLILPLVIKNQLVGFITLGEKLSEEPYSREDKQLLQSLAQQVSIALDYSQLVRQVAEQEKLRREMEIAQEVQGCLFPQTLPPLATLDYAGSCRTARGVGGDYYDFILLEAGILGLALGDVSGKGISAALLMANLQAALRSHAPLRRSDVALLIADINRLLNASTASNKYATFFYGVYDDRQRQLVYVNAGHNPPMLFRVNPLALPAASDTAGGESGTILAPCLAGREWLPEDPGLIRLEEGGVPVGLFPEFHYEKGVVQLHPDDVLVIFSDGISEAWGPDGEEYGEDRIRKVVEEGRHLPAETLRCLILEDVARFTRDAEPADDMTLVVAKVR